MMSSGTVREKPWTETRPRFWWLKPSIWAFLIGLVASQVTGHWTGVEVWSSAVDEAVTAADDKATRRLATSCMARFAAASEAAAVRAEIKAIPYSGTRREKRGEIVAASGWATLFGEDTPDKPAAEECAEQIANSSG